ncbi:MAG: methyltransferase domain-containing protein [Alphaproteobacteria bacterium]|nr:methyltransferase domain-containing protein [Alphaproteobacteria bacterium]
MINWLLKYREFIARRRLERANILYVSKDYPAAILLYQKILHTFPDHYAAYSNLASSYYEMQDYSQALPLLEHLAVVDADNPWWQVYLSKTYQHLHRSHDALNSAWQAAVLSDFAMEQQINLAYSLYEIALEKGADFVLQKVDEFHHLLPDSAVAKQCYAAFHFDDNFTKDEPEYIEKMFDIFAPEFDTVLAALNYDSPARITAALAQVMPPSDDVFDVLDLGCGSGLCAFELVKKFPKARLFGVDISAHMLHQASLKNLYTQLVKKEITAYLAENNYSFPVIISADVLTYFGRLDSLFSAIASHLSSGGFFLFTVSENQLNDADYFLHLSSRFSHRLSYVEKSLQSAGLSLVSKSRIPLRREGDKDIIGAVFTAVKN